MLGGRDTASGNEDAVAAESIELDIRGYKLLRDGGPGEAVLMTLDSKLFTRHCAEPAKHAPCIFEYVYLARPAPGKRPRPDQRELGIVHPTGRQRSLTRKTSAHFPTSWSAAKRREATEPLVWPKARSRPRAAGAWCDL